MNRFIFSYTNIKTKKFVVCLLSFGGKGKQQMIEQIKT